MKYLAFVLLLSISTPVIVAAAPYGCGTYGNGSYQQNCPSDSSSTNTTQNPTNRSSNPSSASNQYSTETPPAENSNTQPEDITNTKNNPTANALPPEKHNRSNWLKIAIAIVMILFVVGWILLSSRKRRRRQ